ncbi:MAG: glycosyl hydrolase family 57 [Deltaproteobacteria bacterium]|nr:glycosyl hydrolase family 57 [Deltaproteobacteria bacterium]
MNNFAENIDGIPNVSGLEREVEDAIQAAKNRPVFLPESTINFGAINSAAAIALHMHQPLIPAGYGRERGLEHADLISNLDYMMNNQGEGDNHNAPVFRDCYKRIGRFVPELVSEGKEPRVMLEYSGTLLFGMKKMGLHDVFESLNTVAVDPRYRKYVEWLGCPWGHAVAPSTPVQDFRLHVKAWQNYFAALFGLEAVARVRGFSPSEMALPNHPDVSYEFVKTLKDCGYEWVLVQEHTVELPENGHGPEKRHLPHRLVCRNSKGESASIVCFIKTQGSDTKLVAQMQPYYEAQGLSRWELAGKKVPPLVTQIADGENGGVMMNEFPGKFLEVVRGASGTNTPLMNCTEYLEHLYAAGIKESDLPELQPIMQKKIWDRFEPGAGPEKLTEVIEEIKKEDGRFHMEGGSWTNNISWVRGYENVLGPMERVSSLFNERLLRPGISPSDQRFRKALYYMMSSQTSCYRYWGQGTWTDYGREICRRAEEVLKSA